MHPIGQIQPQAKEKRDQQAVTGMPTKTEKKAIVRHTRLRKRGFELIEWLWIGAGG